MVAKKASRPRKSGKQLMKELPIANLSPAQQRDLLLELVDCFRQGFAYGDTNDVYRDAVSTFEKYDIDVTPDDLV
jgi:hypothetical protein